MTDAEAAALYRWLREQPDAWAIMDKGGRFFRFNAAIPAGPPREALDKAILDEMEREQADE